MGFDGEPEYSEALVKVVLPYGSVPISRAAFENFAAPDIVDEHIDVAVIVS